MIKFNRMVMANYQRESYFQSIINQIICKLKLEMEPQKIINYIEEDYSLEIVIDRCTLTFYLSTNEKQSQNSFLKHTFTFKELPIKIQTIAGTRQKAIQLFSRKNNFIVDKAQATIFVILRQIIKNQIIEKKVPIQLKKSCPIMKPQELSQEILKLRKKIKDLEDRLNSVSTVNRDKSSFQEQTQKILSQVQTKIKQTQDDREQLQRMFMMTQDEIKSIRQTVQGIVLSFQENKKNLQEKELKVQKMQELIEKRTHKRAMSLFTVDGGIQDFETEMVSFKEMVSQKLQSIKGLKIKWKFEDSGGHKYNGEYQGQLEGEKPNGIGRFIFQGGFGMIPFKIEGQWRKGKLHGKSIQYYSEQDRKEHELKDGKYHGKYLRVYSDGRREEKNFRNGQQIGIERKYQLNKDKALSFQYVILKDKVI